LTELSNLQLTESSRLEIELAIWFHDVVYDPLSKDNEVRSADLFSDIAKRAGMDLRLQNTVRQMILATQKHELPADFDTHELRIFLDIDLAILGANPNRFREYNESIRAEYSWVPTLIYNSKRKKVLKHFMDRETLYYTAEFRNRYETSARENIKAILES
jgi:predicted metal-dependent HD superfamily phosphohydrolase